MECPACKRQLQEVTVGDVTVDVCQGGCAGIWFDNYELRKFDEPHEEAGETLLDVERDENVRVDHAERRNCPKCGDVVMMRHFFSVKKAVELDECPGCGGMWLDAGELGQIRGLYSSEEERRQAAQEYFDEVFGGEMEKMKAQTEHSTANRVANVLKFLSPSYYFSGKAGE
jgi:Zn-finger nucleic acid-binding protein